MARIRRAAALDVPPQTSADAGAQSLVRALALTTFLLWLGASAILPLLPEYLRDRGATDALVGVVMASYFVAALACQYPAGRIADKVGRRPVLIGGLVAYAAGSFGFLAPVGPAADIGLRSLQGAGAGAAEVAALAMVAGNVSLARRGRAFASIYGAQLAAMAVGPLAGSLIGLSAMSVVFFLAGAIAVAACLPAIGGGVVARADTEYTATNRSDHRGLPRLNRSLVGALCTAGALGLTIGVYESCWTLLLESHHAHDWQVGLSWTLFAVPFVAMARPAGWLADHADPKMARHLLARIVRFLLQPLPVHHQPAPVVGTWWPRSRGPGRRLAFRPVVADPELGRGRAGTCARAVLHERDGSDRRVGRRRRSVVQRRHLGTVRRRGGGRGCLDRMPPDHLVARVAGRARNVVPGANAVVPGGAIL